MSQPPPPSASGQPAPPQVQPAGWYHDGVARRWWDGHAWGPYEPATGRSSNDKTMSIVTHGGILFGGFIVPLVFYVLSNDDESPETRWHSREALNFQITFMIVYFGSFALFFGGLAASGAFAAADSNAAAPSIGAGIGFGLSFVVFFAVIFCSLIANFAFSVIGAVRANNGVRWKYPLRIPFLKP